LWAGEGFLYKERVRAFIAFDLDGVLYNAEPFLGEAYREAIARVNERRPGSFPRVPSTREILDHVGWPVPVILQRLFPGIEPAAFDLLYHETLPAITARVRRGEGVLFPGVGDTLRRMHADGYRLAVASNGRRAYVEAVMTTYGLAPYFVELIAVESGSKTTKVDLLRAYIARDGIDIGRMVMVGDRSSDVEAAQAVGCRFVGCDYGHGYRAEIDAAGPIVSTFEQLPEAVRELGL
jgi:phosphoglycolate phosphatase-like HAD superfamily hydrolase